MNPDQKKTILDYLFSKKLPLDLLVEVEDHIQEQIEYKMQMEDKPFYLAWIEVQQSWNKDFKMVFSFSATKKITKFENEIRKRTSKQLWKKTFLISGLPILVSVLLLFFNKTLASYWMLFIYAFLYIVLLISSLWNLKIVRSTSQHKKRPISYLQNSVTFIPVYLIFIPSNVFINFSERFERLRRAFINVIQFNIGVGDLILLFSFFLFFVLGIFGFLNLKEYKRQIEILKQKINFKL